ncbi:MAG: hypothetical protein FJ276_11985 [Planctomycetes bacterium]|nr:hypothetical protein [Planctomycetota bacterium]
MTETDLYRAVARATGEPVDTLRRLGFWLVDSDSSDDPSSGPDLDILANDWDGLEEHRLAAAAETCGG